MSFAGHVFDMIRRNKEDRQMIGRYREEAKDRVKKSLYRHNSRKKWDLKVEDLEKIRKETEAKKQREQSYYGWIIIVVFGIAVVIYFVWGRWGGF